MSVVNKMLQDLEARQGDTQDYSADYQPSKTKGSSRLIIYLLLVSALIIGGWIFKDRLFPIESGTSVSPDALSVLTPEAAEPSATQTPQSSETTQEVTQNVAKVTLEAATSGSSEQSAGQTSDTHERPNTAQPVEENLRAEEVDIAAKSVPVERSTTTELEGADEKALVTEQQAVSAAQGGELTVTSSHVATDQRSLRDLVQFALKSGQEDEAIDLLYRLLAEQPSNVGARKKLAAILFARNRMSEAESVLIEGVRLIPEELPMRLMLARLYFQQDKTQLAFDSLGEDIVNAYLYPDFVSFRASLAEKFNRYELARQDYKSLVESQPDESRWWLGYAVSLERLNQNARALAAYETTSKIGQLPPEVLQFVNQRIHYLAGS